MDDLSNQLLHSMKMAFRAIELEDCLAARAARFAAERPCSPVSNEGDTDGTDASKPGTDTTTGSHIQTHLWKDSD